MDINLVVLGLVACTLGVSFLVALITTPIVKALAQKVGAVDDPNKDKDPERRMHSRPVPRMGGLAIFLGFLISVLLFGTLDSQIRGMLLGAVMIVILGVFDDIYDLPAKFKFLVQIVVALIAVFSGNVIEHLFTYPLGWLAIPVSVIWIVGVTNAVNLIDGLDGLACGVSTIGSMTLLVIALLMREAQTPILVAALVGGCLGFLPYNLNPAKIFMGDTGSTFLGFTLGVISIQGLFKHYMFISFVVPFLMLGLPIFDTCFAFVRRIAHGQSPMHADRSHVHHRLIDMGFSQKQAVAILYIISAILGLSAVVLATTDALRAMLVLFALCVAGGIAMRLYIHNNEKRFHREDAPEDGPEEEGTSRGEGEDEQ